MGRNGPWTEGNFMADIRNPNSLSPGDALFLYFEREGQPVNVASVNVFDGVISLDRCMEFIESKLPFIPRYLQRVATPLYNIDLPCWEYDPEFDLRNHVREVVLKRGTEIEFKNVAGQILSTTLNRKRPLWDFTLVHGLKGNRTGAVIRMHHCLADGIAGVGLLNALLDPSPTPPRMPKDKEHFHAPPPRPGEKSLLNDLISSSMTAVQRILAAESEFLTLAKQVIGGVEKQPGAAEAISEPAAGPEARIPLIDELQRVLPELAATPNRLPFNTVCRGPQKFNWFSIPLAEIKAVKQACGATVNDVVLAVVTSTVRRYAELHGVQLKGQRVRIIVPVNLRGNVQATDLGNRITFLPVDIPLDIVAPRQLIDAVRAAVARARNAHLAELVGLLGSFVGAVPNALQALVGPLISQLPLSLCNLICTNVPGPQVPLYFLGHRLLSCHPYVPIGGEMGMNCAVLTYDGTAFFGFTGDAHAIPDLRVLDKLLSTSFAEMLKSVGVRRARPNRERTKPRRARVPAKVPSAPKVAAAPEPIDSPSESTPTAGEKVNSVRVGV
jgi:diacylglycerol O-acyltransferase